MHAPRPSLWEFVKSFGYSILSRMSGPLSVLSAVLAFLWPSTPARYWFVALAIVSGPVAAFEVWRGERNSRIRAEQAWESEIQKSERDGPVIDIKFNAPWRSDGSSFAHSVDDTMLHLINNSSETAYRVQVQELKFKDFTAKFELVNKVEKGTPVAVEVSIEKDDCPSTVHRRNLRMIFRGEELKEFWKQGEAIFEPNVTDVVIAYKDVAGREYLSECEVRVNRVTDRVQTYFKTRKIKRN
jgi:hypothetical protein